MYTNTQSYLNTLIGNVFVKVALAVKRTRNIFFFLSHHSLAEPFSSSSLSHVLKATLEMEDGKFFEKDPAVKDFLVCDAAQL
jgi:hypothetical protein